MNIKQIIEAKLIEECFDGLFNVTEFECSCKLGDDFMPCDNPTPNCEAGYLQKCDCNNESEKNDCEFHIGRNKDAGLAGLPTPKN